jgi:glycosyltransferase involved in cell wall biosynthesis
MVGGAEHAIQMICEGMASRGHQVRVVTHQAEGAARREVRNGVEIIRVPCKQNRYAFTLLAVPVILRLAASADLIHTVTFNAAPPSWLAAKILRRPILVTVWETWIGHWAEYTTFSPAKVLAHEVLERAIFALPYDRYVAISKSTERHLSKALPRRADRIGYIYLGFDPAPWQVPCDRQAVRTSANIGDEFLVVAFGRPGVSKGFRYLIEAGPRIAREIPGALLLLILSEAPQYRADLAALKELAGPNVRFLPSQGRERLVQLIKSADCVVVPSIAEGFGYSTLEACAADTPVVASQTTSIPEVIGGSFVFCEPRSADSIAAGVAKIAAGKAEHAAQHSFPWSTTIDLYEAEYYRLKPKLPMKAM